MEDGDKLLLQRGRQWLHQDSKVGGGELQGEGLDNSGVMQKFDVNISFRKLVHS